MSVDVWHITPTTSPQSVLSGWHVSKLGSTGGTSQRVSGESHEESTGHMAFSMQNPSPQNPSGQKTFGQATLAHAPLRTFSSAPLRFASTLNDI